MNGNGTKNLPQTLISLQIFLAILGPDLMNSGN